MSLAFIVVLFSVVLASSYGAYLAWSWLRNSARFNPVSALAAGVLAVATLTPFAPAYAQTTLEFDLSPFFSSLNTYLPIFIGLFAIVGGIAGAMALARYVINAVVNAFKGGSL